MKLLRFGPAGHEKPGLVDANGVIRDLSAVVDDIGGATLLPGSLAKLKDVKPETLPTAPAGARIGPCVAGVGKIICVGLNYSDHAKESNMAIPTEPILFMKPVSSICGPNDHVEIPRGGEKTDWEVELGVVIGKTAKYVEKEHALEHVAGYCVVNDVSERAFQLERGGQWDKGKGHDTFAPIGPWLVTRDEVPDPQNLAMWLDVDGHRYQNGSTQTMIFDVATLVSYISQFMTLQPGDVIATGTPPGVGLGQKPPVYLHAGQTMKLGIAGLGEQTQLTVPAKVPGR
ncbi:fumarylacetoacetate hydrolase family protein [Silvimonas sp.]|uniref:fumarylacetoacetate hydrolase family protein n=1 Tax=Silvimonas sp. TaxID=2650811 RepID=UPI00284BD3A6|nr:fumarylacetoacetate hydrolase family protein [Silvimonas sp.]MDR3428875.1 fumarylacetoacetate hydrolase family protein [Silvimonas sp.]